MTESVEQGLILMVAGMGTVYLLLALLVWLIGLTSRLARRLEPAPVERPPPPAASAPEDELVAVIGAAVRAHRERTGQ